MSLPSDELGKKRVMANFVCLYDCIKGNIKPGEKTIDDLIKKLEGEISSRSLYLSLYRFSVNQIDTTTRFMFLYNILLFIKGDEQKNVDNFIRSRNPSILESPRPDRPEISETIYTRLRNEVAHCRRTAVPENTVKEIMNNVENFQSIVKAAVLSITTMDSR